MFGGKPISENGPAKSNTASASLGGNGENRRQGPIQMVLQFNRRNSFLDNTLKEFPTW